MAVSFIEESGLLQVQFKAPPNISASWQVWNMYVIDESRQVLNTTRYQTPRRLVNYSLDLPMQPR